MNIRLQSIGMAIFALVIVGAVPGAAAGEIVIGQVAPFSGTLAPTGNDVRLGIQAYFSRINAEGGIRGNTLRLVSRDDGYRVEDTLKQTTALIEHDAPVALVGFVGTGNVDALRKAGTLDRAGIPLVGVRSGASVLRKPVPERIFHTRASYAAEVDTIVRQMSVMGLKRIAVFHQNDPFGEDGVSAAQAALSAARIELVATGAYEKGGTEVAAAVEKITAAKPDGVILVANTAASAAFVKAMRERGSAAMVIALSVTAGPQVAEAIGNTLAHGLGIVQVVPKPQSIAYAITRQLDEDLKRIGSKTSANHTVLEGYIMAKVLVEGIRRAGEPTPARIVAALNGLGSYDAGGVTIRYAQNDHTGSDYTDISIIDRNGQMIR
ncbi:ABC transporter substrate-binding protein [Azoarcus sp. L1K30]|uniref:ABC transporter substrate-binding protein n=1 Tax=Azoarcus sp. L1K30 TaxID=2820277 RepID=UPI001B81C28E|nr:ABC transporter substrate-binding protein [Azoarcus sp. L1K30]MBR0565074.1 ABC transporter substrate-binding protein [Azoarcus sp. L1K30]